MADYVVPTHDGAGLLVRRWRSLQRRLGHAFGKADGSRAEKALQALPAAGLARLVPPIDWSSAASAISAALDFCSVSSADPGAVRHRASAGEAAGACFLVGQPYCDHAAIVRHWAKSRQARVLEPPEPAQILSGDSSWLETLPGPGGPVWVLPAMERCFLRHANGLDLVRRLLERALAGEMGAGIIACDSWAFAFVQQIWPLPDTPALTLQAFDGPALSDYFLGAEGSADARAQTRFMSARSGQRLRPDRPGIRTQTCDPDAKTRECPLELRQLAARCRGNPGLAWHHWRAQLCAQADRDREANYSVEAGARRPEQDVVWVGPEPEPPSLSADTDEEVAFVLHALLLHRGLTTELLALVLPVAPARVASRLLRLQAQGLLVRSGACWQVAPLAYPAVRAFLCERGYLDDPY